MRKVMGMRMGTERRMAKQRVTGKVTEMGKQMAKQRVTAKGTAMGRQRVMTRAMGSLMGRRMVPSTCAANYV